MKTNKSNTNSEWQHVRSEIFWGEIAPCDHVLQIYDNDEVFLDALAGFVGAGINSGECCIVIATDAHLVELERKLSNLGIHVENLLSEKMYVPVNANDVLAKFMVNGWPDEDLFNKTISELIGTCTKRHPCFW